MFHKQWSDSKTSLLLGNVRSYWIVQYSISMLCMKIDSNSTVHIRNLDWITSKVGLKGLDRYKCLWPVLKATDQKSCSSTKCHSSEWAPIPSKKSASIVIFCIRWLWKNSRRNPISRNQVPEDSTWSNLVKRAAPTLQRRFRELFSWWEFPRFRFYDKSVPFNQFLTFHSTGTFDPSTFPMTGPTIRWFVIGGAPRGCSTRLYNPSDSLTGPLWRDHRPKLWTMFSCRHRPVL